MAYYNIVAQTDENTVVTEYIPVKEQSGEYQSEAELEEEFIRLLCEEGYERLDIKNEDGLINNLRSKLSALNDYTFTDNEWRRFFHDVIAKENSGTAAKTKLIQEEPTQLLHCDDGNSKNIKLIDKNNIHNNFLQVINQYEVKKEQGARHDNRYDVTVLVNGLPLVHIELKRRGVRIREAFNQIDRYRRDSFWAGKALFEYVQIFVISNGTETKYYSNTTREGAEKANSAKSSKSKSGSSFDFTSFWADAKNRVIPDLMDFAKTFFAKHTLLNILTKYCVFTSENVLLVMRPYQITAAERILDRIKISETYKKYGSIEGGGYVWHTTGSGKTLTSFKSAVLASSFDFIDKVLFVVDRKDLDYQTMKEYDRFQKGAANGNTSTRELTHQLQSSDPTKKIIITTIQKLASFIKKNKGSTVFARRVVIIFDECHRSQFGDMHAAVVKYFKKYNMFGFTGTPILSKNSGNAKDPHFMTTDQTFGERLHTYTIVDAIRDKNVLPFRVDYIRTMSSDDEMKDEDVPDINRRGLIEAPERVAKITEYILNTFNRKTYRGSKTYAMARLTNIAEVARAEGRAEGVKAEQRVSGFNSIFAVDSVTMAKLYYREFQRQMKENPSNHLNIAVIYSYGANEAAADGIIDEENPESTQSLDKSARDFLDDAIKDYNAMFKTAYSTESAEFQSYYKDVSLRMKNKELDLLIVVNMFLTGFDAPALNTLWVDKNLRMHGLIQAFSRTNRIFNSVKTYGNIVCFRALEKPVDEAIALFGDKEAGGVVLMRTYNEYYNGYETDDGSHVKGYTELIAELQEKFPLGEQIVGEKNQKEFVSLMGAVLRTQNILSSFDEFDECADITERDIQNYRSLYLNIRDEFISRAKDAADVTEDVVFEIELVKQLEINIDYILMLVAKYHKDHCKDKEILTSIKTAVASSPDLRSKRELIDNFINEVNDSDDISAEWQRFVTKERENELSNIIAEEKLNDAETRQFLERSFAEGEIKETGTELAGILPKMRRFGSAGVAREAKKQNVIARLKAFFEKYFNIGIASKFVKRPPEQND